MKQPIVRLQLEELPRRRHHLGHLRHIQLALRAQVAPAGAALHPHPLLAKVAPTRRSRPLRHLASRLHQSEGLLHLLRSQMPVSTPSRLDQHTRDAHEQSQVLHRVHLHLLVPQRLQWRNHSPVQLDLGYLRLSRAIARSQHPLRLPVAAQCLQVLHHLLHVQAVRQFNRRNYLRRF
jgi:hypothetical protein